jgi:DNA-binding NarL/FixJ family response regulator
MALRCLIVDDNAGFRDEVRALLEEKAGISGS